MICIARVSAAVFCALTVGCAGSAGDLDDADREAQKAEEQARDLAAPHEEKARECEAAGKLREAIPHYVAAIQALPEGNATAKDFELREKVIKIVVSLDPPPAIPDDIQHIFDRAEATAKAAKDEAGWLAAAQEYERALRYAPWEAKGNYNAGLMYELLKKHAAGAKCLKLYLAALPSATDKAEVQKKIADLEQKVRSSGIGALAGIWEIWDDPVLQPGLVRNTNIHIRIEVAKSELIATAVWIVDRAEYGNEKGDEFPYGRFTLQGRKLVSHCPKHSGCSYCPGLNRDIVGGLVSEDFAEITLTTDEDYAHGKNWGSNTLKHGRTVLRRAR